MLPFEWLPLVGANPTDFLGEQRTGPKRASFTKKDAAASPSFKYVIIQAH
jgi:hypothetical protein